MVIGTSVIALKDKQDFAPSLLHHSLDGQFDLSYFSLQKVPSLRQQIRMNRAALGSYQAWKSVLWASTDSLGVPSPSKEIRGFFDPSYYEAVNRGDQEVPEYFNFASDVVDKWMQEEKDGKRAHHPAFWWVNSQNKEVKWSFEELAFLSRKAANVLSGPCGLQRGDRVLIILPRIPEWWLLILACMRTGIIFIPGTPQLTAKDISYRIQASKAQGIVVAEQSVNAVDSIIAECKFLKTKLVVSDRGRAGWLKFNDLLQAASGDHDCIKSRSEELMLIYFTSGSTGLPKMVEHCHSSYGIGFTSSGSNLFGPWIHGSCVFVHHLPQFEPTVILNTLVKYPITTFCTAPTAFRMMVQHNATSYKFRSLKHCVTGGEPLNPEVTICANVQGMKIKSGSMGRASPPYDVQVVDDEGNIQPPGKEGDVAIRTKPKRPFSTERGDFYITGDRAVKDEEGYFWFVGRSDDIINSSGYRIGPFEVESALMEHPAVVESAVVTMKTSLAFYTIWKKIPRLFPRCSRYLSSPISAQYEAISQGQDQLPEYFNFASDVLDKWTQMEKDGKRSPNPALWWINGRGGEVRWSFEEMGVHSRKVANILTDQCGLRKGDRILVILSRIPEWWLDIEYRLQASGAKCLVTTEALGSAVDSVAPWCPSLKTKLLVSSEGKQEGWLNFDELLREAPANHACAKTKMNDPMLVYFTSGTTGAPKMEDFTRILMSTFLIILCMLSLSYKFKSLQYCISGGESISLEGSICSVSKEMKIKPGTMGKALFPYDVQVDRGVMDEDGYFRFIGRADDIINSSGSVSFPYRIGPFEVENVLLTHPAVAEVAAISSPDPIRGEVVKAFVVLSTDYATHNKEKLTMELQEHVKKTTAPYKYPRKAMIFSKSNDKISLLWKPSHSLYFSDLMAASKKKK
ncbi:hypothetical protein E2320_012120 [Naja naja]|nr:hypothetical protein E2320_012120 [Naja naja]